MRLLTAPTMSLLLLKGGGIVVRGGDSSGSDIKDSEGDSEGKGEVLKPALSSALKKQH